MLANECDRSLTSRQQLVWLEQQLDPEVPMNNLVMTFTIEGPLEPERLARAFDSVVRESDALRTVIEEIDGAPRQRVLVEPPAALATIDLSADPARFEAWLDEFAVRRFDLSRAVYASALVKLGPDRWCWVLCLHHVITDGRSFELLYERVAQRYADPAAPALAPASYAEYRAAERSYRASQAAAASGLFWQSALGEPLEPPHYYGEAPRPEGPALYRTVSVVEASQRAQLEALAGEELGAGLAPDFAMTACFLALLATFVHRVGGGRRVGIGFPVQNRRTRPQRQTIGLLMEVQTLQIEIDPRESFTGLLRRTHSELVALLRHARYCNARAPGSYDVMLNYNPTRFPAFCGWPTRVELLSGACRLSPGGPALRPSRRPRLVLQVQDFEGRGGHRLDFDLNAGCFAGERAGRVTRDFDRLLGAVLADPGRPIEELACSDAEIVATNGEAASEVAPAPPFVAPRTPLETTVANAWAATLGIARVGVDDDFFDLGGHSSAALDLFRRLRDACGMELPLATLFRAPTVARMAAAIAEQREHGAPAWSTLVEIHGGGDLPPLYCAAGMGGNVTNLRRLALHLGVRQPFYGLQTRGVIGHREMPHERVEEIARESLADLRHFQPRGPYYLAGYSAGGAVAFEMAKLLESEGEEVAALLLLDAYAPSVATRTRTERLRTHYERLREGGPGYLLRKLRDRAIGDAMRLRDRFVRFRTRWQRGDDAQLRLLEQRSKAQLLYAPEPSQGRGVLFRVARSPHQVNTRLVLDESNGWSRYLLGGVEVVAVPGGHLDMCEEPHVRVLAERIAEALETARMRREARPERPAAVQSLQEQIA